MARLRLPVFAVKALKDGSGYAIEAVWVDGSTEQLVGVYVRPEAAERWIAEHGEEWASSRRIGLTYH